MPGTGLWWWCESVILVQHNLNIIPPTEHNFEHNYLVSSVRPESRIFYFSSIIRQTLSVTNGRIDLREVKMKEKIITHLSGIAVPNPWYLT